MLITLIAFMLIFPKTNDAYNVLYVNFSLGLFSYVVAKAWPFRERRAATRWILFCLEKYKSYKDQGFVTFLYVTVILFTFALLSASPV